MSDRSPLIRGTTNDPPLLLGDDVEISGHMAKRLGVPSGRARVRAGTLHICRAAEGLWVPVSKLQLQSMAAAYSGEWVRPPQSRAFTLRLSEKRLSALASGVLRIAEVVGQAFPLRAEGAPFENGLAEIHEGSVHLREYRPADGILASEVFPGRFDPAAEDEPALWVKFLSQTFQGMTDAVERIEFLESFAGLAMLGATHRYKRTPVLYGQGDTGKSVVIGLVESLFPPDRVSSVCYQDLQSSSKRAMLVDARLNTVTELPSRPLRDTASIKAILSGELVDAKLLYKDDFSFRPRCAHLVAANELPDTVDRALLNRWSVLHFPHPVPKDQQDVDLLRKLRAETPLIVRRFLNAAARTIAEGRLDEPPSSTAWRDTWSKGSDSVLLWMDERLEADPEGRLSAGDLYPEYAQWASTNGFSDAKNGSRESLGRKLADRFEQKRTARHRGYQVRLRGPTGAPEPCAGYDVPE